MYEQVKPTYFLEKQKSVFGEVWSSSSEEACSEKLGAAPSVTEAPTHVTAIHHSGQGWATGTTQTAL